MHRFNLSNSSSYRGSAFVIPHRRNPVTGRFEVLIPQERLEAFHQVIEYFYGKVQKVNLDENKTSVVQIYKYFRQAFLLPQGGLHTFLGGRIEGNEDYEDAAIRELFEEMNSGYRPHEEVMQKLKQRLEEVGKQTTEIPGIYVVYFLLNIEGLNETIDKIFSSSAIANKNKNMQYIENKLKECTSTSEVWDFLLKKENLIRANRLEMRAWKWVDLAELSMVMQDTCQEYIESQMVFWIDFFRKDEKCRHVIDEIERVAKISKVIPNDLSQFITLMSMHAQTAGDSYKMDTVPRAIKKKLNPGPWSPKRRNNTNSQSHGVGSMLWVPLRIESLKESMQQQNKTEAPLPVTLVHSHQTNQNDEMKQISASAEPIAPKNSAKESEESKEAKTMGFSASRRWGDY